MHSPGLFLFSSLSSINVHVIHTLNVMCVCAEEKGEQEDKVEEPSPSSRVPKGLPRMGFGANVLADLKAQNQKRFSTRLPSPVRSCSSFFFYSFFFLSFFAVPASMVAPESLCMLHSSQHAYAQPSEAEVLSDA